MDIKIKSVLPHLLVVIGFILVALFYFKPVLQGKKMVQSDIRQTKGMTRERTDFRKEHHKETYWINNAFGGMPLYLPSTRYPHDFVRAIDQNLRFLPAPADYLFLYFIGLYILFLVFKVDYKLAVLGALAFGFSTYLIIIIGVGHISKVHAVAYMPFVLAGIFSVFKKHYFWGGLLLAVSLALEIFTGHYQITYYLMLVTLIIGGVYLYRAYKTKGLPRFFKSIGVMFLAAIIGVAANATKLLTTEQYTQFSTRGDTGLTITKDGQEKTKGLDYDYITQYSYGFAETLNLFIPRFTGGASNEQLDTDSHTYKALIHQGVPVQQARSFINNAPTYWGEQPIVASPNYIGATVIFLFILALYLIKGPLKWWVVISSILALLLSWGYHLNFFTKFFVNYVPLYAKFRTVSMIQVILQMLIPFFGILGLTRLFSDKITKEKKLTALKWTTLITGGVALFFILFKNFFFDFSSVYDRQFLQNLGPDFVDALRADRKAMLTKDSFRTLIFVLLLAGLLWAYLERKLKKNTIIPMMGILILIDLVPIDLKYVTNDGNDKSQWMTKSEISRPFTPNEADKEIMKDKSHYRVLDLSVNPMNTGRTAYFHNALGGYHGAKPGRFQELFDFYIGDLNQGVLNMLNTKYIIFEKDGHLQIHQNYETNGNAWLVDSVDFVNTANAAITALKDLNTKTEAVVEKEFKAEIPNTNFEHYPGDTIYLKTQKTNEQVYHYSIHEDRLAVFSEMYYPYGWHAKIDGKEVPISRADYVLRAVLLPQGEHEITFNYAPRVIKTGSIITLSTGILVGVLLLSGLFFELRKKIN